MPPPSTPGVMRAPHSSSTYCTASKLTSIYPNKTPHSNTIPRSMNEEAAQYYPGGSQYPSDPQANQYYPGGSQYSSDPLANQYYPGDSQYPPDPQANQYYSGDSQYPSDQQANQYYPGDSQYPPDPQASQYYPGDSQKSSDNRFLSSTEHYTWNTTMLSQVSCDVNQVTSSTSDQTLSDNPNATHSSFVAPLNTDVYLERAYGPNQVAQQQSTTVIIPEKQVCNVSSSNLPETMDVHSRLDEHMSAECAATNLDTAITSSENALSSAKGFSSDDTPQVIDQAYEQRLIKEFEDLMNQIDLNYESEAISYFGPNYKSYFDQKENTDEAGDEDEDNDDENDDDDDDGDDDDGDDDEEEDDDDDDI
ncbi:hypothetical protein THOM_2659 [Trachipleistophora hominis]|uniref:Uncharacterized protein n=1 Tax=Trachipleistophora hominis TaxID=72359 RepID=L7JSZ1_TRAHO|nr:hypothetical protein THOM_2659 [Trachipleistophora hominis]